MSLKDKYFPSKYLKSNDLQGRQVTVMIDRISEAQMRDGKVVAVMYFQGKEKGCILNVTKWNLLEKLYGQDPQGWSGKQIDLKAGYTKFGGETVKCIDFLPPAGLETPNIPDVPDESDDDISMSNDLPF